MDTLLDQLATRLHSHVRQMLYQTGLDLNRKWFELHVHPTDWADFRLNIAKQYGFEPMTENELLGFKVVPDTEQERGKAELRCTWRLTI